MLKRLYISNFALIDEMDVTFPGELTVITGETGAGKSIFLEALGLLLGNRADATMVQSKKKKCILEAEFEVNQLDLHDFFNENEVDEDAHLIIRREISADGKTRSFLNDTPVSLNVLKQLSGYLIDVHSQHQTLLLNQSQFQFELLDSFAGTNYEVKDYKKKFALLKRKREDLANLRLHEQQAKKEQDYYTFLFNELEEAKLTGGRLEMLEAESSLLENAEQIKDQLNSCVMQISSSEVNILQLIASLKSQLQNLVKINDAYEPFFSRVNSVYIELKELGKDLEMEGEKIECNPSKLRLVNEQLDELNRLLKKHQVKTETELIRTKEEIQAKLSAFISIEETIEKLSLEINELNLNCKAAAKRISLKRQKSIIPIQNDVKRLLSDLSMPNAEFKISLTQGEMLSNNGIDEVTFLFSANKGVELNELYKVASGGELSRLMLTLKSMLATKKQLATIIFDEIDTGVSGEVANKIGLILEKMSKHLQVISITHLPQMAVKGSHHLFVFKMDEGERTSSYIKTLTKEERIVEIAKMLSAGKTTDAALKNAKELLKN
jgi:DNA repair protein RecN (Recombination protein N)